MRSKHDKDKPDVQDKIVATNEHFKRSAEEPAGPAGKKPKKDSWGFINFNPDRPAGEDDASINSHKQWLKVGCFWSIFFFKKKKKKKNNKTMVWKVIASTFLL